MLFDKMIKKYHNNKDVGYLLHEANLFDVTSMTSGLPYESFNDFFLPFNTIALETPNSCIIFSDTIPNAKGMKDKRVCFLFDQEREQLCLIIFNEYDPEGLNCNVLILVNGKFKYTDEIPDPGDRIANRVATHVMCGLRAVNRINHMTDFILEESPIVKSNIKKKGYLLSHQRPKYTILTPKIRRKTFGTCEGSGGTRIPHAKRRHYRKLSSPVFKKKQGQTIVIPACWVGPSEAVIKGKKYKVRLDL